MEVPPGMAAARNGGKVCELKRAFHGLKNPKSLVRSV